MPRSSNTTGVSDLPMPVAVAAQVAIGGPPAPISSFALHAASDILHRLGGARQILPFNRGGEGDPLAKPGAAPAIMFFDVPDAAAAAALRAVGEKVPLILADADFVETAIYCMAARDMNVAEAGRFVAQSFACLHALRDIPGAQTLRIAPGQSLDDWLAALARLLGIADDDWAGIAPGLFADYAAFPTPGAAIEHFVHRKAEASRLAKTLGTEARTLLESLRTGYAALGRGRLVWPAEILLDGRPPHPMIGGPIALTGPARLLTFGPFMHLPPGRWRARYCFETQGNEASNVIEFDIFTNAHVKCSGRVRCAQSGRFGLDLEFSVEDPTHLVEMRCFVGEGAIGGVLRPLAIEVQRVAADARLQPLEVPNAQ